jgi:hypothetical protein
MVIYVQNVTDAKRVKTSDYLGDITDEMAEFGTGSYIKSLSRVALKTRRFLSFAPPQESEQNVM